MWTCGENHSGRGNSRGKGPRQGEHLDGGAFVSLIKSRDSMQTATIRCNFIPGKVTKIKSSRIQFLENGCGIGTSQALPTVVEMCGAERQWQGEQAEATAAMLRAEAAGVVNTASTASTADLGGSSPLLPQLGQRLHKPHTRANPHVAAC